MRKIFINILLMFSMMWLVGFTEGTTREVTVFVNDQLLEFDAKPTIIDGRTLVPMRAIFEALDCDVQWDEPNQKVFSTTKSGEIVTLFIGNNDLYKNYEVIGQMDVPAQIMDARTFVPLRAVSEALDCEVLWVAETYEVVITSSDYVPNQNGNGSGSGSGSSSNEDNSLYGVRVKQGEDVIMEIMSDIDNKAFLSDEIIETIKDVMRKYTAEIREKYESDVKVEYRNNKTNFQMFTLNGNFDLMLDDKGYLSYRFKGVINWQGKSIPVTTSATINSVSNTAVSIDNIVTGMSQTSWNDFYVKSFNSIIQEDASKFYTDASNILTNSLGSVGFYLVPEGVVFYMPEGVIADHSKGAISFLVEFEY